MTDGLYIGAAREGGARVFLDTNHLTTHAICLGMTGSGKTGLGIVTLEELARRGVPLLIIDLKGDMLNLLLNFPDLSPPDFEPWLPPDAKTSEASATAAAKQAALWRKGLKSSGLEGSDVAAVARGVRWQLVTPGIASGAPLDILPSLIPPPGWDPGADPDGARDRVNGLTSALLSLADRGGDPLSDPDHVLVASIILENWRQGRGLDLAGLLSNIADPPIDHLGALPLETFYPRDRRMKLVMALNTLIASPSFAAWTEGVPLDMEHLLGPPGNPSATIITLAHLDDRQRQFCLALVISELVAWMRRQPASSGLRALLYIDEVHGILPPYPANPPTKGPLLTLLKQGRAFGTGVWLATQNPVDLDYKALGNAGVKVIGRLITERDRDRALEGLGLAGTEDGREIERVVASLAKREFLLHDIRAENRIQVFSSRWAMSYLRGPVALSEMGPLLAETVPAVPQTVASSPKSPSHSHQAEHQTEVGRSGPPVLPIDVPQLFGAQDGLVGPSLLIHNRVTVERRTLALVRTITEFWRVPIDQRGKALWDDAEPLETEPELSDVPPSEARFPVAAPEALAKELRSADRSFVRWRARRAIPVLANTKLKCVAEIGESRDEFLDRCLEMADRADDSRQDAARRKFERKIDTIERRLERERDELERDQVDLDSRHAEERLGMVEGLFSVLLGSRSLRSAAGKATSKLRSSAGKRRMRQKAEASVQESEHEIDRIEHQLEDLAAEMQDEIESIAAASDELANTIEEVAVRPKQADVTVKEISLVWGI
ncbi:MAG: DUF87 domain-containing protein [Acidobacteria bacterium]|nr:DUF87 domain-containing protein [Acidobacteriota bacterium]